MNYLEGLDAANDRIAHLETELEIVSATLLGRTLQLSTLRERAETSERAYAALKQELAETRNVVSDLAERNAALRVRLERVRISPPLEESS